MVRGSLETNLPLGDTLGRLLTPPEPAAVQSAVSSLRIIGALGEAESLTPLGAHLACMPMDARLGKMLLFGALLRWVHLESLHTVGTASTLGSECCQDSGSTPWLSVEAQYHFFSFLQN
jgi:HrpA-like RNA helicase